MTSIYTAKELLKQKYGIGKVSNLKTLAGNSPQPSFSAPAYSPPGAEVQSEPDGSVGFRQEPQEHQEGDFPSPDWKATPEFQEPRNLNDEVQLQDSPEISSLGRESPFVQTSPVEVPKARQKTNDESEIVLE